jgi:hypothetical protein
MDETLQIPVEKSAVPARSASDIEPAMSFFSMKSDEGSDGQAEEMGDLLVILRLKKNAPFAVTTLAAFLALKGLHHPVSKVS